MTIPFYCVIAQMLVTYLLSKIPVFVAIARQGRYDNSHPRDQQAKMTGWGRRALAAHQNGLEFFPVFAAGVILAHLAGGNAHWSAILAVTAVVSRVIYIGLYIADLSTLRSVCWSVGMLCSGGLALLGAVGAA